MAKVSPIQPTFASGVWSPLMGGRVDNDKYGSALKDSLNTVPVSQGPAIRRPGTKFVTPVADHTKKSRLVPFAYGENNNAMLAFSPLAMRVLTEAGPILRAATAVSAVATVGGFAVITSVGHGAAVGDYVYSAGFDTLSPLNSAISKVTAVAGNNITLEAITGYVSAPTLVGGETVARVFSITTPYSEAAASSLRYLESADVIYCFSPTVAPNSVAFYDTLDWRVTPLQMRDGPYLSANTGATTVTPSNYGNMIPQPPVLAQCLMSSGIGFDGLTVDETTAWVSTAGGTHDLGYDFLAPKVASGYAIHLSPVQLTANVPYASYAPMSWLFIGWDGVQWVTLDTQYDYLLYDGARSIYFDIPNTTAYTKYMLHMQAPVGTGSLPFRIRTLTITEQSSTVANIVFTASSTAGINKDQGFKSTDIGRAFRYKGNDSRWRWGTIVAVASSTVMSVKPYSDALVSLRKIVDWRMGLWSDTTGFPTCAYFYGDRMWFGGTRLNPDTIAYTKVGGYADTFFEMAPTAADGVVAADNGGTVTLTARKVGSVKWISSDDRGVTVGTGTYEWTVRPADKQTAMSAINIEAKSGTSRGSADIEPVNADGSVLFVQKAQRTLRELSFDASKDGYIAPSMSLYASHLGKSQFKQLAFTAEPHSIAWVMRADGALLGFTYNREEGVLGWHPHALGGSNTVIEDIAGLPAANGSYSTIWLQVARTVGGVTRRYIEVLQEFWRDGMTHKDDAWFFDCALAYTGALTNVVSGLWHLEGQTVGLLADGAPQPPQVVTGGRVFIGFPAAHIVAGLPYESFGETMRPNSGASDGTAQGKTKRTHSVMFRLWDSQGGQYRRPGEEWVDMIHRTPADYIDQTLPLVTGDYGPVEWQSGYDSDATLQFRQPGEIGLPLNVVAIMPQMVTQDRG